MRYLIVICLFLACGCNNAGNKKGATEVKLPVEVSGVKTVAVEFAIKGMTCTGCEQTIQSGISSLKGVKQVKANYKNGKAFVEFLPDIADTIQMKEKIAASGYIVAGIQSVSLDSLRSKL
jgi:copper chaperone CopZ